MKLKIVDIEGFRSIRKKVTLNIEPNVTVVLGPNDHGKSNVLAALLFLNEDARFEPEDDLNWDLDGQSEAFPELQFLFSLSTKERKELLELENTMRKAASEEQMPVEEESVAPKTPTLIIPNAPAVQKVAVSPAPAPQPVQPIPPIAPATEEVCGAPSAPVIKPTPKLLNLRDIPDEVAFYRRGIASSLNIKGCEDFFTEVTTKLKSFIPRVELIKPYDKINDSVTAPELVPGENEFMRGIFYYADLDPDNCEHLFDQNDRTTRKLRIASEKLESTLKKSWSQGENLKFSLNHKSKTDSIELLIEDPAVSQRMVRASHRSAGFTNYFAIKTILHARQQAHQATSYILLFDEPGLYLHPSGQFDLLQVIETLAKTDQVIYVTHSLFLINKSHPTRHRLVRKTDEGTTIEGKPFVGRWGTVLSALGLTLSGTILFANEVLLTEGDSDPIYVQVCFQRMIAEGKINVEINGFSAMGTGDGRNADVMLRTLAEAQPHPRVMMLFDGDDAGKSREREIKPLLDQLDGTSYKLEKKLSIEDYLLGGEEAYVRAVVGYALKLIALRKGKNELLTVENALIDLKKMEGGQ